MTPRPPQSEERPKPPVSIAAGIINTLFLSGEADGYDRNWVKQQLIERFKDYETEVARAAIRDFGEQVKGKAYTYQEPKYTAPGVNYKYVVPVEEIDRLMEEDHA